MQGLVFVQIKMIMKNNENSICQFLAFISMEHFRVFPHLYAASFSIKTSFYETNKVFYLKNETYFHKTVRCF